MFNLAQLATLEQAKECAAKLSVGPIVVGGGVKALVGTADALDSLRSGIYRPEWNQQPWSIEPFYEDPTTKQVYRFYHFRFNNGAEGMNVGLIMDKFKRYPSSPMYVLGQLAAEAASMVQG